MFKKLTIAGAALVMGVATLAPTAPAAAQTFGGGYYDAGEFDRYGQPRFARGGFDDGRFDRDFRQYRGRNFNYNRGFRGRQPCRDGDGGTIVGAIAGGLAGNAIAGRGDRTLGTILGGALGAVAGRAIDRSDRPNFCR